MLFVGHVVGSAPPSLFSWLAALVLIAGFAGMMVIRNRRVRQVSLALAIAGFAAKVADIVIRSERPKAPDLVVRVCGYTPGGAPESPTGSGRHLLIRLNGMQIAEVRQSTIVLPVEPGKRTLSVEITSPVHQEYQPAILIRRTLRVHGARRFGNPPSCGRHV